MLVIAATYLACFVVLAACLAALSKPRDRVPDLAEEVARLRQRLHEEREQRHAKTRE